MRASIPGIEHVVKNMHLNSAQGGELQGLADRLAGVNVSMPPGFLEDFQTFLNSIFQLSAAEKQALIDALSGLPAPNLKTKTR